MFSDWQEFFSLTRRFYYRVPWNSEFFIYHEVLRREFGVDVSGYSCYQERDTSLFLSGLLNVKMMGRSLVFSVFVYMKRPSLQQ